jgi:hypothetical protein
LRGLDAVHDTIEPGHHRAAEPDRVRESLRRRDAVKTDSAPRRVSVVGGTVRVAGESASPLLSRRSWMSTTLGTSPCSRYEQSAAGAAQLVRAEAAKVHRMPLRRQVHGADGDSASRRMTPSWSCSRLKYTGLGTNTLGQIGTLRQVVVRGPPLAGRDHVSRCPEMSSFCALPERILPALTVRATPPR